MSKNIVFELRKNRLLLHSVNATGWLVVGAIFFQLGSPDLSMFGGFAMFFAIVAKGLIWVAGLGMMRGKDFRPGPED